MNAKLGLKRDLKSAAQYLSVIEQKIDNDKVPLVPGEMAYWLAKKTSYARHNILRIITVVPDVVCGDYTTHKQIRFHCDYMVVVCVLN